MCEILGIPPDPLVADVVIPKQNEDINSNNPTQRNENENEGQITKNKNGQYYLEVSGQKYLLLLMDNAELDYINLLKR